MNETKKRNRLVIVLLIFIVLMGFVVLKLIDLVKTDAESETPYIEEVKREPEVKVLKLDKAWVVSNSEDGLFVWYKKRTIQFPYTPEIYDGYEEIVDLTFHDGILIEAKVYEDKVTGKLLEIGNGSITLEEEGTFSFSEDLQIYKLFGEKEDYTLSDLKIGYSFTDFVLDGDQIIAALVMREEAMENIRVAIKNQNFAGLYHEKVSLTPDCDYIVYAGDEMKECPAGETLEFTSDNDVLKNHRIKIQPKNLSGQIRINSITRDMGTPSYTGTIELMAAKEGIVVINELPLEEYLYGVVPSEMPAGYPIEALKAQAISARTYAYKNIKKAGLPNLGAHVDDSVSYQVYNNIKQDDRTTKAVRETSGQILMYEGNLAQIYYYSTSCGYSTDLSAWGQEESAGEYLKAKHLSKAALDEEKNMRANESVSENLVSGIAQAENMQDEAGFEAMIRSKNEADFEAEQDFYRWSYTSALDTKLLTERLQERYEAKKEQILTRQKNGGFVSKRIKDIGKVIDVEITKRSKGGAACELVIYGSKQTVKVISEYNVRYILLNETKEVTKQSGEAAKMSTLLPSSFLMIETVKKGNTNGDSEETEKEKEVTGIRVYGGGYGHGIGMSQNGAKAMGEAGYSCEDILSFFFDQIEIVNMNQSRNES